MSRRVIVIGAGPVGLAAALELLRSGAEVTVLERNAVGHGVRSWGPTRFFTPVSMNVTGAMREILGRDAPPPDAILTGPEFVDAVLGPVAETLGERLLERHRVVGIGRRGLTRIDHAGHPLRAERPFRLLLQSPQGESNVEADVVLDATGNTSHPMPFGSGGLPAIGESSASAIRSLAELAQRRTRLDGKRILLVGHGHSAATALPILTSIEGATVTWAVRTANRRPCGEIAGDPLPERQAVVTAANDQAAMPPPNLTVLRRASVEEVAPAEGGGWRVRLTGDRVIAADEIVSLTGYRPDGEYLRELELDLSPVSEGTAALYRKMAMVTDCLTTPQVSAADFATGEPGFFFIGARAYGRNRNFLLQTGYSQLPAVLAAALR